MSITNGFSHYPGIIVFTLYLGGTGFDSQYPNWISSHKCMNNILEWGTTACFHSLPNSPLIIIILYDTKINLVNKNSIQCCQRNSSMYIKGLNKFLFFHRAWNPKDFKRDLCVIITHGCKDSRNTEERAWSRYLSQYSD